MDIITFFISWCLELSQHLELSQRQPALDMKVFYVTTALLSDYQAGKSLGPDPIPPIRCLSKLKHLSAIVFHTVQELENPLINLFS